MCFASRRATPAGTGRHRAAAPGNAGTAADRIGAVLADGRADGPAAAMPAARRLTSSRPPTHGGSAMRPWVRHCVHLAERVDGHQGVDLRGRHGSVTEQFLDDADVGAAFEQMRGERMPQGVRGDHRC